MAYGPHNSKASAYEHASIAIREAEAIKAAWDTKLASAVSGDDLLALWTKCKAHLNTLRGIRENVPGILDYAESQHPDDYDIVGLWAAMEDAYAAIIAAAEAVLFAPDGTAQQRKLVDGEVQLQAFAATDVTTARTKVAAIPDIRDTTKLPVTTLRE